MTEPLTSSSELYGLPLDRFVAERAELAKALRREGRKEEAVVVGALRKPSVAAWTVNQIVRTQQAAVSSLFEAGDALGQAQSELLAGRGDAQALREAAQRERQAVDDLAEVARGLLSSEGHEPTQTTLDRVSATLHAAALDEEARMRVREACLERELRQVGFGATGAASGAASTASERAPESKRDAKRVERERAERAREEQIRSARRAEATARREAERTARQVDTAQERRDRAAGALRDADDALAAARERAEEAALTMRRAQQALDDL